MSLTTDLMAQIAVGPKAGINFNSFRGNNRYDVVLGYNAGVFAKYPLLDFLTLRGELLYMQQGAKLEDYTIFVPELRRTNSRLEFNNLQVPILLEFGLPQLTEEDIKPKIIIGGFYSYSLSTREVHTSITRISNYYPLDYKGTTNMMNAFERSQYGIIGAIAGEVKIFSTPVALEFRYHYNINRVNTPESVDLYNLVNTQREWGSKFYLTTLSFNVALTLHYF